MFSGIVEEIGIVEDLKAGKNLSVLKVRAKKAAKGIRSGASIAVDGVCLTVTGIQKGILTFDIMRESLNSTTLGTLKKKFEVNLERALKADSRIDGHFVTGHVDCVCTISDIIARTNYTELVFRLPGPIARYVAPKGSVCIDGVSLTVGKVSKTHFSVYLIPFTKKVTTLGAKRKGDKVNLETDILAKYILNRN